MTKAPAHLIAIGGLSGSGKSTLSRRLAAVLGAEWLRSDEVRKELWGCPPTEKLPPEAYSRDFSEKTYAELGRRTETALRAGRIVIVDMVFARESDRIAAAEWARGCGAAFTGLWLEAPEAVLKARVTARRNDVSDADAAVVDLQLASDRGRIDWRRIAAGAGPEEVYSQAAILLGIASNVSIKPPAP